MPNRWRRRARWSTPRATATPSKGAASAVAHPPLWRRLSPVVRRHLTTGIGLTVVINVALGFFIPNIDNACHIGGLAAGLVIGALLPFSPTTETFLRPAG